MKFIFVLLSILSLYISSSNSQIFNGDDSKFGVIQPSTSITPPFNELNLTAGTNIRTYKRYDWSMARVYLRSNDSDFTGYINIHPRVDEFTTFRIPNTQKLIFQELRDPNKDYPDESSDGVVDGSEDHYPGWQLWVELVARKTITSYTYENVSTLCEVDGVRSDVPECATPEGGTPPVDYFKVVVTNSTQTIPLTLPPKNIIDINTRTFVNYLTIVIQLDKGRIIDAMWDGDRLPEICKSCDSCIDNQCGVNYDDMQCETDLGETTVDSSTSSSSGEKTANNNNGCQVKLMVAWAGRDSLDKPCQSINKIPSNFQKYSATSIKNVGTGLVSDFFYKINENNNNPNRA